jgi:hypothetical protein
MKYQLKKIVLPSHVSELRRLSAFVGRTGMLRELHLSTVNVAQTIHVGLHIAILDYVTIPWGLMQNSCIIGWLGFVSIPGTGYHTVNEKPFL